MTQRLVKEVKKLSEGNKVPGEEKFTRRIDRLQRMIGFYEEKVALSPPRQSFLFFGFISALKYSIQINYAYRRLTINLKELAESVENDNIESEKNKE